MSMTVSGGHWQIIVLTGTVLSTRHSCCSLHMLESAHGSWQRALMHASVAGHWLSSVHSGFGFGFLYSINFIVITLIFVHRVNMIIKSSKISRHSTSSTIDYQFVRYSPLHSTCGLPKVPTLQVHRGWCARASQMAPSAQLSSSQAGRQTRLKRSQISWSAQSSLY